MSESNNSFQEEQFQEVNVARKDANQLIPSLESAYYGLIIQGYYLPKITSSIITSEYLLNVLFGKYFVPKAESISIGILLKPASKQDVCNELIQLQIDGGKQWGISTKHLPDKLWCINVLKTLVPNHLFFAKHRNMKNDSFKFTQEQFKLLKELDTSYGRKSNIKRFFLIPKEKQAELQKEKEIQRKAALENKLKRKKQLMLEAQQEAQEIQNKIQKSQSLNQQYQQR